MDKQKDTSPISTAQIVYAHRCLQGQPGKPLPLRTFAHALGVTHETIRNWERGNPIKLMTAYCLLHTAHASSWQSKLAKDILSILAPDLCSPASDLPNLIEQAKQFNISIPTQ